VAEEAEERAGTDEAEEAEEIEESAVSCRKKATSSQISIFDDRSVWLSRIILRLHN
jgi:hypothetical protein